MENDHDFVIKLIQIFYEDIQNVDTCLQISIYLK